MPYWKDITGTRFGRLVATEFTGRTSTKKAKWLCRCDCGGFCVARTDRLTAGKVQSCGCLKIFVCHRTHGEGGSRRSAEYQSWCGMLERSRNPTHHKYRDYGGRGITVCDRWLSYENFLADMGRRPTPKHSIDRIDNNGGYSPENCRWATLDIQSRNRRNNRLLTYAGETLCVADWERRAGLPTNVLLGRLNMGWPIERALTAPVRGKSCA